MKYIMAVLVIVGGIAIGLFLPNADLTPCERAVVEARHLGLQGAEHNIFIGQHGCVLDMETGRWLAE